MNQWQLPGVVCRTSVKKKHRVVTSVEMKTHSCCSPNSSNTIYTTLYRKPTHKDRYLDWNSNCPTSAKRSVIQALTHRAGMVCSILELLAKEMDYLHRV